MCMYIYICIYIYIYIYHFSALNSYSTIIKRNINPSYYYYYYHYYCVCIHICVCVINFHAFLAHWPSKKSLSNEIKNKRELLCYITSTVNSISIHQFIENDILAVISMFKNCRFGYDVIPNMLLTKSSIYFVKPLTLSISN